MVVRFGALGDMVLMTVAIRRLYERFGQPVDVLGSGEWTRPLLEGQKGVGEIYLLRSRRRPFWLGPDQWRLVGDLRRRGAGATWLFDAKNAKTRWLLQRAGWHPECFVTLDDLPDIPGEPFCDRWGRFADLGPSTAAQPRTAAHVMAPDVIHAIPQLQVSERSRMDLVAWLARLGLADRPFILIQVGNKRTMHRGGRRRTSNTKYWPEQRWAELLRGLRALHPQHALLLLGVSQEGALNDEIMALAAVADAHNLARGMTVSRLMALAEHAAGMISVDTGPAHVAAALGCRLLVLFDSPAKQFMYQPTGPGPRAQCLVGGSDKSPSLWGILPEQVLHAWQGQIRQHQA